MTGRQFELIAKALADPRRMSLLETIAGERACPCQRLREQFPVSKATISHHIKELVRAGLVDAHKEGQYLNCEVRRDVLAAYTAELMRRVGNTAA
jgi:ArsR family transcriptional regulator, arsenate/arsenite/antimonite-responsive transcriptional repressor